MKVVYSDLHQNHDPQLFLLRGRFKRSNEQPERAYRLLSAVQKDGHEIVAPADYGSGPRACSTDLPGTALMKTSSLLRFLALAGLMPGRRAAESRQDGAVAAHPPALVPAVRVQHAAQAGMLCAARAGSRIVAAGDHGVVLLSDDGARSPRQAKSVPVDVTLTSVSFVDEKQGWAVGHWGVVLHTVDGGDTWEVQRSDVTQARPLFAVHFSDPRHGVAVGLWSIVLVTEDGGKNWQTVNVPIPEGAM